MAERPMEHFTVDGVNIFEVTDAKARQDVSDLKDGDMVDKILCMCDPDDILDIILWKRAENPVWICQDWWKLLYYCSDDCRIPQRR